MLNRLDARRFTEDVNIFSAYISSELKWCIRGGSSISQNFDKDCLSVDSEVTNIDVTDLGIIAAAGLISENGVLIVIIIITIITIRYDKREVDGRAVVCVIFATVCVNSCILIN